MRQVGTDYNDLNTSTVDYRTPGAADMIADRMESRGFAVVGISDIDGPPEALGVLARALQLGDPHIPETGRKVLNTLDRYKQVSDYPGPEGWHVDGLLEDIGTIKVTALYCVRPAAEGGQSVIFNSLAAFMALQRVDAAAAHALMSPDVLNRRPMSPDGSYAAGATGPAFSLDREGNLISRFSDNHTCDWNTAVGRGDDVERGLAFLRKACGDSTYRTSVRLVAREALIFRNDRVAHDRTVYRDDPAAPRLLVRALYAKPPRSGGTFSRTV
jgi:hypothetical protein